MLGVLLFIIFSSCFSKSSGTETLALILTNNFFLSSGFIILSYVRVVWCFGTQCKRVINTVFFLLFLCVIYANNTHYEVPIGLKNKIFLIHPLLLFSSFFLSFQYIKIFHYIHFKKYFQSPNFFFLLKWFLLTTFTIILGGYWAQQEFNWGGWWSWDSVEMTSLWWWLVLLLQIHLFFFHKNFLPYPLIIHLNYYSLVMVFIINRSNLFSSIHNFTSTYKYLYIYLVLYLFLCIFLKFLHICFNSVCNGYIRGIGKVSFIVLLYVLYYFIYLCWVVCLISGLYLLSFEVFKSCLWVLLVWFVVYSVYTNFYRILLIRYLHQVIGFSMWFFFIMFNGGKKVYFFQINSWFHCFFYNFYYKNFFYFLFHKFFLFFTKNLIFFKPFVIFHKYFLLLWGYKFVPISFFFTKYILWIWF